MSCRVIEPRGDIVSAILEANGVVDPLEQDEIVMRRERITDLHAVGRDAIDDLVMDARRIVVHADYDTDGVMAGLIAKYALDPDFVYVPTRVYGYGLRRTFAELLDAGDLIVTVDCGSSDYDAIQHMKEHGISVLVTDHHSVSQRATDADYELNPHRGRFSFTSYCGASVAMIAFWHLLSERQREMCLQLAAAATVADVMPMRGPNRYIVREGLKFLKTSPHPLLSNALRAANGSHLHATEYDLGWKVSPVINSLSRMGEHDVIDSVVNGIIPPDLHVELRAINDERKRLILESVRAIMADVHSENDVHDVFVEDYRTGFTGLLATRLARDLGGLCIVTTTSFQDPDLYIGSMRSDTMNCHGAVMSCRHLLESGGGHVGAAGFRVRSDRYEAMLSCIRSWAASREIKAVPRKKVAIALDVHEAVSNIDTILSLSPYGHSFPEPTFIARARISDVDYVGKQRFPVFNVDGHRAICFSCESVTEGFRDILYSIRKETFRGKERLGIEVRRIL